MRSVTATRSKPFSRNSRAAVSTTRALFSATFSFVSRMPAVRPHRVDFDDIRHQTIMTYIINSSIGRTLQDVWVPGGSGAADMVAQALADRLSRRGIHYGWVIVAVTFLTSLTTAGAMGLPGALILPLSREFGWDIAEISSAIAIRLVLFGLMAPVAAALIESYGVR